MCIRKTYHYTCVHIYDAPMIWIYWYMTFSSKYTCRLHVHEYNIIQAAYVLIYYCFKLRGLDLRLKRG